MFLMIFFTEFLTISKKSTIAQVSSKLKDENNSEIKERIMQYLSEVGVR
jgi:hypothetical protein